MNIVEATVGVRGRWRFGRSGGRDRSDGWLCFGHRSATDGNYQTERNDRLTEGVDALARKFFVVDKRPAISRTGAHAEIGIENLEVVNRADARVGVHRAVATAVGQQFTAVPDINAEIRRERWITREEILSAHLLGELAPRLAARL